MRGSRTIGSVGRFSVLFRLRLKPTGWLSLLGQAFSANWDDWDEISADWDDVIPVSPCHWDDIIPVDGGWLPQWDEALDELTAKIEAVYFAM